MASHHHGTKASHLGFECLTPLQSHIARKQEDNFFNHHHSKFKHTIHNHLELKKEKNP